MSQFGRKQLSWTLLLACATFLLPQSALAGKKVLRVRLDGPPPRRVYLAPCGTELPHAVAEDAVSVTVPELTGYAVVVFEE